MNGFKLQPNPTFRKVVEIRAPGGATAAIDCEFRHFSRPQLLAFSGPDAAERTDAQTLAAILAGWHNVDEPMTPEALQMLVDNYPDAAWKLLTAWSDELTPQRLGN